MTDNLTIEKSSYPQISLSNTAVGRYASMMVDTGSTFPRLRLTNGKSGDDSNMNVLLLGSEDADVRYALEMYTIKNGVGTSTNILHSRNYKDYAVPLDGSNAANELKIRHPNIAKVNLFTDNGAFGVVEGTEPKTSLQSYNSETDTANRRIFNVKNANSAPGIVHALTLEDCVNNGYTEYVVLHTGNKPSGSYTGNGSAAARTINVGGITSAVLLYSNNGTTLVTPTGGILHDGSSVLRAFQWSELHLTDGDIYLATTDIVVNENGKEYYYRAL